MSDLLQVADLERAKLHDTFHSEVITGKAGGVAGGSDIDFSTNQVTGQVQATLPKILSQVGFAPASFDFITGGTLSIADRNKAIFYETDGNWYSWGGTLPKTVATASSPNTTGGIDVDAWNVSTSAFMYRDWRGFSEALYSDAGMVDNGLPDTAIASQRLDAMKSAFDVYGTVADLAAGKFKAGKVVTVTDRGSNRFNVVSGTPDGALKLDAGPGNIADLSSVVTIDARAAGILVNPASSAIAASLVRAKTYGGAEVITPSGSFNLTSPIEVPHGCILSGQGVPHTFDSFRDSTTFVLQTAGNPALKGVQIGESGTASALRNRAVHVNRLKVIGSVGATEGTGFCTVDTDLAGNDKSAIKWRMDTCVANNLLIGFDIINSWNYEMSATTAIGCGIGHRIAGGDIGGGTSNLWTTCLSYNCGVGFDIEGDGWNYSSMIACGADGCDIGLRVKSRSARGSSVRNFGIERLNTGGTGILVDISASGYFEMDGVNFGTHNEATTTFIKVLNSLVTTFKNVIVTSGALGSCKFYTQGTPASAGKVKFQDLTLFTQSPELVGDIFASNVVLADCNINGRSYVYARGGTDIVNQSVKFTSSSITTDGQGTSNKQLYSVDISADTNSDGSNRFITGTPAFDTSKIKDYTYIKFTNSTNTATPAQIGFRSEDHTAGTGIVRDPAFGAATTITLAGPGDWVIFQKRPDGKLYEVIMVNPPI